MGWFSGLLSGAGKLLGGLASGAAGLLGGFIPSIAGSIVGGIKRWFEDDVDDIDEAPRYNPATASFDETRKMNELLNKCVAGYKDDARDYDRMAQRILEEQFEEFEKALKDFNDETNILDDSVFIGMNNQFEMIKSSIKDIYIRKISDVFTTSNNNLLDILKLDAGTKKERLTNLALDTLDEANDEFTGIVKKIRCFYNRL